MSDLSDLANPSGDFVISSSGSSPDEVRATLAKADAPPAAEPVAAPAAEPPADADAEAAGAAAAEAAPVEGEPPSADDAAVDDAVAAAAAKLPKGDSKAGKTLSDRARVIQAEIHQLTYQKHQTRTEAEQAREELAQLRAERERIHGEIVARQAQPPAAAKPKSDDFDTFEAYTDALGQFYRDEAKRDALAEAQQMVQQVLADERQRAQQYQQQQELNQVFAQHQTNIDAARAAHPDFDEVVAGSALPTNPMMETHIPRSPVSGELLHYLATHPDECVQIARMGAGPTLVALGRLEARIEGVKSGPPPVRPPVVSRAQRPIKPVGAASATADDAPDATVSLDEHVAYWNRRDREVRSGRR